MSWTGTRPTVVALLSVMLVSCTPAGERGALDNPGATMPGPDGDSATTSSVALTSDGEDAAALVSPAPGPSAFSLDVDTPPGGRVEVLAVDGPMPVTAEVVTRDDGSVVAEEGPGGSTVLRLPPFVDDAEPARAAVVVLPVLGADDPLAPGRSDFTFGVDFVLDDESAGTDVDNGDNLIQRGLASDPSQYKIEVDGDRLSCLVKGPEGTAAVGIRESVEREQWYQVRCSRYGSTLRLALYTIAEDGSTALAAAGAASGPTGDLRWRAGTPLSVGAKATVEGALTRRSTDQFNGAMSHPVLEITE